MKSLQLIFIFVLGLVATVAAETTLTLAEQRQIIENYLLVTGGYGKLAPATSLGEDGKPTPIKCGMSAAADFRLNYDRLDPALLRAYNVSALARPSLPLDYTSPSGKFAIHYAKTGDSAVYQSGTDSDGDGVPDFVEQAAKIADSVRYYLLDTLGYPAPPDDSFYIQGGDERFDIYMVDLGSSFYGLSYIDEIISPLEATSFMLLDNDYRDLPSYSDRPLDAIRVTIAHEYFHSVQFGMDFTEAENYGSPTNVRRYWMEISAVWMEDEQYDDINDYYFYLPHFFGHPRNSLQQFLGISDSHPYASMVFARYLSEIYGRDIIRHIWERCADGGVGPQFLQATDQELNEESEGTARLNSAFRDFALWNYFTGSRADYAPNGIGYEEAANYPEIPEDAILHLSEFPIIGNAGAQLGPQHNGALYMQFDDLPQVQDIFYTCTTVDIDTTCAIRFVDTLKSGAALCPGNQVKKLPPGAIPDSCLGQNPCNLGSGCLDTVDVFWDSTFTPQVVLDTLNIPWGSSLVYRRRDIIDSFEVDRGLLPSSPTRAVYGFQVDNPDQFCSMMLILTPSSTDIARYTSAKPDSTMYFAFVVDELRTGPVNFCAFDSALVSVQPSVLDAYPNPAVKTQMTFDEVRFRFRIPTKANNFPVCTAPFMEVDIFTIAGERVATVSGLADLGNWEYQQDIEQELAWNMTNASGSSVSSGVYLAVARLYCDSSRNDLLAEDKTKVAIIR